MWRFPYSCVLHRLGTPSSYCVCATLPQENPLIWELPLQPIAFGSVPTNALENVVEVFSTLTLDLEIFDLELLYTSS
jgi:hypothetical protein